MNSHENRLGLLTYEPDEIEGIISDLMSISNRINDGTTSAVYNDLTDVIERLG